MRYAAAILAGGKASRYGGTAKGLIEIEPGVTILGRMIGELTFEDVIIVANDASPYESFSLPIVPDLRPGIGPLGGIEAALAHFAGRSDAVLLLPSDLPGITSREVSSLLSAFEDNAAGIVFARTELSIWHPLCAVVHAALLGPISAAIDRGTRRVREVWRELGATPVDFDDPAPFFNVNTPEDLARFSAHLQAERGDR